MLDTVVIRVAIGVSIEMCQLDLAIAYEEILECDGECPAGYEIGDWSDGGGECCCDPSNQPEEEEETTPPMTGVEPFLLREEPVTIESGEEPISVTTNGEEPITVTPSGEEPIFVTTSGEEPISLTQTGEEPITVPTGEEPITIGGEEPILIGETPIEILPPLPTLPYPP